MFPDIGTVRGWIMDMTPIWEANKATGLDVNEEKVVRFVEEYPLPPEQVWGYLTNPEYRSVFSNARRQVTHDRRNGRVGQGTVYECFHMDNSISTNTVLEWQPFSRIVTENTAARSSRFLSIIDIEPIQTGSRVTMKWAPPRGPLIERGVGLVLFLFKTRRHTQEGLTKMRLLIEKDIANGTISIPEPIDITKDDRNAAADAALTGLPNK